MLTPLRLTNPPDGYFLLPQYSTAKIQTNRYASLWGGGGVVCVCVCVFGVCVHVFCVCCLCDVCVFGVCVCLCIVYVVCVWCVTCVCVCVCIVYVCGVCLTCSVSTSLPPCGYLLLAKEVHHLSPYLFSHNFLHFSHVIDHKHHVSPSHPLILPTPRSPSLPEMASLGCPTSSYTLLKQTPGSLNLGRMEPSTPLALTDMLLSW